MDEERVERVGILKLMRDIEDGHSIKKNIYIHIIYLRKIMLVSSCEDGYKLMTKIN